MLDPPGCDSGDANVEVPMRCPHPDLLEELKAEARAAGTALYLDFGITEVAAKEGFFGGSIALWKVAWEDCLEFVELAGEQVLAIRLDVERSI